MRRQKLTIKFFTQLTKCVRGSIARKYPTDLSLSPWTAMDFNFEKAVEYNDIIESQIAQK